MSLNSNGIFDKAYNGNVAAVKSAVEENKKLILEKDTNQRLLIHWAALSGSVELIQYLLDQGSPVDPEDDTNMTPLIIAASAGKIQIVQLLISKGANINARNDQGHSALQYSASKGWQDIVQFLLIKGADINIPDKRGARPLHRAASKGNVPVCKVLLEHKEKCNLLINPQDVYGNTPLHLACEEGRLEVILLLMKYGASTEVFNKEEMTPLQLCSPQVLAKVRNAQNSPYSEL